MKRLAFVLLLTLLPAATQTHEIKVGNLVIVHPMVNEAEKGQAEARGSMEIRNEGPSADRLLSIKGPRWGMLAAKSQLDLKELNNGLKLLASGRRHCWQSTVHAAIADEVIEAITLELKSQMAKPLADHPFPFLTVDHLPSVRSGSSDGCRYSGLMETGPTGFVVSQSSLEGLGKRFFSIVGTPVEPPNRLGYDDFHLSH